MPYVEINRFTVDGVERKSWLWRFRYATAAFVAVGGAVVTGLAFAGILQF